MTWSHVALNCRDPLETERFYTRGFGFTRARVVPLEGGAQIVFLKLGSAYLELFQADGDPVGPPAADGPHLAGTVRHLAFQVDDVDRVVEGLGPDVPVTLGPLSFDTFIPGWRTVWVSDPDGVVVEVSQGYTDQDAPPPCPAHEAVGSLAERIPS